MVEEMVQLKILTGEQLEILFKNKNIKIERIISTGQITSENEWYDQDQNEWVILMKGDAHVVEKNLLAAYQIFSNKAKAQALPS